MCRTILRRWSGVSSPVGTSRGGSGSASRISPTTTARQSAHSSVWVSTLARSSSLRRPSAKATTVSFAGHGVVHGRRDTVMIPVYWRTHMAETLEERLRALWLEARRAWPDVDLDREV